MKKIGFAAVIFCSVLTFWGLDAGFCQFSKILKDAEKVFSSGGESDSRVAKGLKEALEIGARNAVSMVSQPDGYFADPDIKIFLPDSIRKLEDILRGAGFGSRLDAFELSMNRAAEQAAPEAEALFLETIRQMSFTDAKNILEGPDDAATQYFRKKTESELSKRFEPIIRDAMADVGVTRYYQDIFAQIEKIPFTDISSFDLDAYVTDKALDGLFLKVAKEEKNIRENPAARVTELLKDIFADTR